MQVTFGESEVDYNDQPNKGLSENDRTTKPLDYATLNNPSKACFGMIQL